MESVDRFELITKLAAVEALEGAPGSEGERQAAIRARIRLEARLEELEVAAGPGCFAEEMLLGHHLQPEASTGSEAEVRVPSRAEAARRIDAWRRGEATFDEVAGWAAAIVDGVVLPCPPAEDPASVVPEVLLVLAGAHSDRRLAEPALRFLAAPPEETGQAWRTWLEALATLG